MVRKIAALGLRMNFNSGHVMWDGKQACKNIQFHLRANYANTLYLIVDEKEIGLVPKTLEPFVIRRPSKFSCSHADMQQWNYDFLRNAHPQEIVCLADCDLSINTHGVSHSSKQFPSLNEVPPVRTENYVSPLIMHTHVLRAVDEFEKENKQLGSFPIDPPARKQTRGHCAYEPIEKWVVSKGYLRNYFIIFPEFQGWFGSPIGTGLGVLEDAHFALSGGRENLGLYQGLCLRWGPTKKPIMTEKGEITRPRNTAIAKNLDKEVLAVRLGLSNDDVCEYTRSRYIKKILNREEVDE